MMPAANKAAGQSIGFPDVCLTPAAPSPVPIPYPNIDMNALRTPPSPNVLITMVPTYNMLAASPMTSGMEGGSANPLFKGAGRTTIGNPKIFVNAAPATHLLVPSTGNNFNNPVGANLVPSVTTVLFTLRQGDDEGNDDPTVPRLAPGPVSSALASGIFGASIPLFTRKFASRLGLELERIGANESLILDLRGCPGGEVDAFVQLADEFLAPGTPLAIETSGRADDAPAACLRESVLRTRLSNPWTGQLVLLIDGSTASAAELFAASLQHHERACVIGSPSYGKAEAQRWMEAASGPSRYATVARYTLPDGSAIHDVGVTPDVHVAEGEDALAVAFDHIASRGRSPESEPQARASKPDR